MCMFCRSLFVLLYCFLLVIVLSALLRFTGFLLPHWYLQTLLIEKRHTRLDEINDLFNSITVNIKSFRVSIKYPDMIVMTDFSAIFLLYHVNQF